MIYMAGIYAYAKGLKPGEVVNVMVDVPESIKVVLKRKTKAKVIKVFPHVTLTTKGVYRNIDLFLWNKAEENDG